MSIDKASRPSQVAWKSPAAAWIVYDFAYSLFIFLFAVRFFPTWVIDDLDRPDWYVGLSQFAVVLVVLIVMPITGALADHVGRRKPFLLGFTIFACAACAALSLVPASGSVLPVLVVASIAIGFGQLAVAQFDPLLADVADHNARGRVSGLAVGSGFVGVIVGLAVVGGLIVGEGSKQRAFFPIALLYLLFALPALALVHDLKPQSQTDSSPRAALAELVTTLRSARQHRTAFQFLLGRFFYSDAIVTLGAFLTVYMTRLGGFSERDKSLVIGTGVVTAALGAVVAGRFVERVGPKRPLLAVLPAFSIALIISAIVGQPWTVWIAAPVAGLALGFVWTADRVFMLQLAPTRLRGQFFAYFNLANRVASAFGPLILWSGTIWLLHGQTEWLSALDASRVAVVELAGAAFVGWMIIRRVPGPAASPNN